MIARVFVYVYLSLHVRAVNHGGVTACVAVRAAFFNVEFRCFWVGIRLG